MRTIEEVREDLARVLKNPDDEALIGAFFFTGIVDMIERLENIDRKLTDNTNILRAIESNLATLVNISG